MTVSIFPFGIALAPKRKRRGAVEFFNRHHRETNLRIGGVKGKGISWVEVELPVLLYGHNWKLIRNQSDMDEAIGRVDELVSVVLLSGWRFGRILRADIVWQFRARLSLATVAGM